MRNDTMNVYQFTLKQMVKNKSNRVVFFILIAVAALADPCNRRLLRRRQRRGFRSGHDQYCGRIFDGGSGQL